MGPPEQGLGPQRTCVGCRRVRPQAELIRIVRSDDGLLQVGRTLPGRGAWLCRGDPHCLDLAVRQGGFRRSFRAPVSPATIEVLRSSGHLDQRG